jgi:tetratricopeptide (TPR) repeat protein
MILLSTILISTAAAAFKNLGEGMELPTFTLRDIGDQEVSSEILKKKKAAVVVFFATWSDRSLKQLGDLEDIKNSLKGQDVEVFAINVDHEHMSDGDIEKVRNKVAELGVTYPVLIDAGLEVYRGFGVVAVPSSAVIRPGGILATTINGYPTFAKQDIRDTIEVLLGMKKEEKIEVAEGKAYKPVRASLLNYNLGRRLYRSGMLSKAERKLIFAIKSDEKFVKPKVLLGDIYLAKSGKNKKYLLKARDMYTKALDVAPGDEAASTGLARVLLKEGAVEEAEKHIDSVLAKNPGYTPALIVKAMILAKKGQKEETDKYVLEAVGLSPMDPEVLALAGTVYQESGNLKEAAKYYRKAGERLGY